MTVSKTTTQGKPLDISGRQTTPWPRIWAARGPIGSNIAFFNAESAARWIADRTQPELYLTTEYVPDSLTAELQKENARLREALIMFRDLFPENHTGDYLISRAERVITQLGAALSKEKE